MTTSQPVNQNWRRYALIFACAFVATLPLAIRGNSCGHDFDFHIQSWLAVAQQWHQGIFYPHWIEAANYMAGEPRFVFYPPLSWMLGAILGIILPWSSAPIAYTLIVLTACGLSMNKLARKWLPLDAATAAACAYILNPYALFVAYERTAYAELAAGIWLPFIILYALRNSTMVCHPDRKSPWRPQSKGPQFAPSSTDPGAQGRAGMLLSRLTWAQLCNSTIPLALTIAAIWLTNAPAAVMACYALAAITLWQAIRQKRWQPILNSAAGITLGLGLASFYILPAAYERRWVDIARAIGPGMRIEDSFLFAQTGEAFHDQVLLTASFIFVTMLVTSYVFACTARLRKTAQTLLLPLSVTATVLFALQLPWSKPLWRIAPELGFLQFPWRWTLLLSISFALSLGAAVATCTAQPTKRSFRIQAASILIIAIAAVSLTTHFFWQPCDEEDAVSNQLAVFKANTGFEGTDEYTPLGADNSVIQQGLPPIRFLKSAESETAPAHQDGLENPACKPDIDEELPATIGIDQNYLNPPTKISVSRWISEQKRITIEAATSGYLALRLLDYPTWQVLANGIPVLNRPNRDDGLMTIPIQPGLTRIEINYTATPDIWWGRALSLASLFALLTLALASQKRRKVV